MVVSEKTVLVEFFEANKSYQDVKNYGDVEVIESSTSYNHDSIENETTDTNNQSILDMNETDHEPVTVIIEKETFPLFKIFFNFCSSTF